MKKRQIKSGVTSLIAGILAPAVILVPSVSAASATVNWSGYKESVDNKTSSIGNWFDAVPVNGDTATFGVSGNHQDVDNDIALLSLDKLIFSGNNTFSSSKSYTITGNGITINSAIDSMMTGAGGDNKVSVDVTLGADVAFKTSGVDMLQVGEDGTTLDLGTNDLTLTADGGTITLAGEIDGSGKLIINGKNKINMLATPAASFAGTTELTQGILVTTDTTEGDILVNGGTLKGSSSLLGNVTMSAGNIAPGNSPGCLGTADLVFTGGSYDVEINGKTVCTEYDSTGVVGSVKLGTNTTLNVARLSSFAPALNDTFAIITNDGSDKVEGSFKGLENGAKFTLDGYTYQINYDAGEGSNDVLVLVTGTPAAPDTGIGSVLANPMLLALSTISVVGVAGGLKFADRRRK